MYLRKSDNITLIKAENLLAILLTRYLGEDTFNAWTRGTIDVALEMG